MSVEVRAFQDYLDKVHAGLIIEDNGNGEFDVSQDRLRITTRGWDALKEGDFLPSSHKALTELIRGYEFTEILRKASSEPYWVRLYSGPSSKKGRVEHLEVFNDKGKLFEANSVDISGLPAFSERAIFYALFLKKGVFAKQVLPKLCVSAQDRVRLEERFVRNAASFLPKQSLSLPEINLVRGLTQGLNTHVYFILEGDTLTIVGRKEAGTWEKGTLSLSTGALSFESQDTNSLNPEKLPPCQVI